MKKVLKSTCKYFLLFLLFFCVLLGLALTVTHFITHPSNNRNWTADQKVLPYADIEGNTILIHNIRNFTYASTTSYKADYYDKHFDLTKLEKVWYVVEPFSGIPGSAHTFLSFEFEGNNFISISVEIRKEEGESFNPIQGLFNQYELMYVIADEQDVIKLRSNYRKDLVYLYPINTSKEKAQALFLDMIQRANKLKDNPEFYNTITNTCTTNIVNHVDTITPHKVPLMSLQVLFPAHSDKLAYDLGLIDTKLSFEEARKRFFINDRAKKYKESKDFSVMIRGEN